MAKVLEGMRNTVKHWYVFLIIGILFIIFGIYIFTIPMEAYVGLSVIFSITFVVSGLFEIFFSVQNREDLDSWGWYLAGGILSLLIGIYLMVYPGVSMAVLPFFVGFILLFRSFQLLGFSFDLKRFQVMNWGYLAVASIIGIIISFVLLLNPLFTGISIVVLTALTFIIVGIGTVILSFDLKKIKDFPKKIFKDLED